MNHRMNHGKKPYEMSLFSNIEHYYRRNQRLEKTPPHTKLVPYESHVVAIWQQPLTLEIVKFLLPQGRAFMKHHVFWS